MLSKSEIRSCAYDTVYRRGVQYQEQGTFDVLLMIKVSCSENKVGKLGPYGTVGKPLPEVGEPFAYRCKEIRYTLFIFRNSG